MWVNVSIYLASMLSHAAAYTDARCLYGTAVLLCFSCSGRFLKKSSAMVPAAMYNRAVPLAKEREYRNGVSKSWWRGVGEDLGIISAYRDNSPPAII